MFTNRMLLGTIVLGLVLVGCGDDEEGAVDAGRDAGRADAGPSGDAAMDAARPDDADTDDADSDDADTDDADTDGGGAFSATLELTTEQEVPVCVLAGDSATGAGTVTIDEAGTTIAVVGLTFSGLSGAVTAGHIHSGATGVAGPAVLPFTDLTSPIDESFTAADYPSPPPAGAPADFAAFVEAMRSGGTYVNLHTTACAPGEIRGQIE